MSKRRYTQVKGSLPDIQTMREQDMRQREIAEHCGFKDKNIIKELLKRGPKAQQIPKVKGRKPAKTLQKYKYENKRLKNEAGLLRENL